MVKSEAYKRGFKRGVQLVRLYPRIKVEKDRIYGYSRTGAKILLIHAWAYKKPPKVRGYAAGWIAGIRSEIKKQLSKLQSKKVNRKRRTTSKEKKELAEVTIRDIMQIPKGW